MADYNMRQGRVESAEECKARLQCLRAKKKLKMVAAEKRCDIRRNCGQEEERRRWACQCTTIQTYFLRSNPRDLLDNVDVTSSSLV
jgi:hypothetical protein